MIAARPYLQLVRAPALFTSFSNIAAAHLVATGGQVQWQALLLLCAASGALLAAGMALNDCFDLAVDRNERPQRPLPSGQVPVRAAWGLGFGLLVAGVALASAVGVRSFAAAGGLALAILLYDGLLKSGPLGPFAMGLCRYLNWMLGLSVAAWSASAFLLPVPVFFFICAITYLSRTEAGPGNRRLIAVAMVFLALAALSFVALSVTGRYSASWVLWAALAAAAIAGRIVVAAYREFSPAKVQGAVGALLFGIIPLDVLIALGNGIWWSPALLLLMIPAKWLGRRLYVT